jgi:hypothetical protein
MAILIVTYDLNKEPSSDDYANIIGVIKSGKNWARLSESCYAMSTEFSPMVVYEKLKPFLDDGDKILVFTATPPYFGQHSKEVIDWLGKKFGV